MEDPSDVFSSGCSSCGLKTWAYVFRGLSYKLCFDCNDREKELACAVIRLLPDIDAVEPPLSYSFVLSRGFTDMTKGKEYCDRVWDFSPVYLE